MPFSGKEGSMKVAWGKIERMIRAGYVHRKGFSLADVAPPFILDQAADEFTELKNAPDDPQEMADLFGVLIHYCIKQGWTIDLIQRLLVEKLDLRFKPTPPSGPASPVSLLILPARGRGISSTTE